mmetsp:Transcript_11060/g.25932  ORF Transcript_11060/g.25932 Transcript_11060/m.25932 type:complete len:286 (-) Transcript_11060:305-1162(-)
MGGRHRAQVIHPLDASPKRLVFSAALAALLAGIVFLRCLRIASRSAALRVTALRSGPEGEAEPLVVEGLGGGRASRGLLREQRPDQVLRLGRDLVPVRGRKRVAGLVHRFKDEPVVVAVEGRVGAEEHVHNHAQTPQVAALVVILAPHLGGGVVNGADARAEALVALEEAREPKVDHPDLPNVPLFKEQKVLRLEVPVRHLVQGVERLDPEHHLPNDGGGLELTEGALGALALFHDLVVKLTALAEFRDEEETFRVLENVLELNDVRARPADFGQYRHLATALDN